MSFARLVLAALGLAATIGVAPVGAATGEPKDTLSLLYRVALSAEICGFPVSEKQSERIGHQMDAFLAKLNLSDEESDALYTGVEAAMEREGWDQICSKDSAWAKEFKQALQVYTK